MDLLRLPTYFLNGVWVNDNTPIATRGIVKLESEDPNSGMDATRQALHDITGREPVKKTPIKTAGNPAITINIALRKTWP